MATGRRGSSRTRAPGAAAVATVAALLLVLFTDTPWWAWLVILLVGLVALIGYSARRIGPRR